MELNITTKCSRCSGTGIDDNVEPPISCSICNGDGQIEVNRLNVDALETVISGLETKIDTLTTKVDAIKAMLDSPTLGMQKMSSNLDDIMVKLDV